MANLEMSWKCLPKFNKADKREREINRRRKRGQFLNLDCGLARQARARARTEDNKSPQPLEHM